jgi:hypothetical protein
VANYRIQPATFRWLDAGLMFPLALSGNGVSSGITLPFPFYSN